MRTLKERLADWHDWDTACYEIGACLGFWPDFNTEPYEDSWNGVKGVIWSTNPLGDAIANFIISLANEGCLERKEADDSGCDIAYRWNPNYKGGADPLNVANE